jgi:hypothetical protein
MVRRLNRRRASDEAEGSSANARRRQMIIDFLFFDSTFDLLVVLTIISFFRLIQWNPSPAPANQPLPDDSSKSDGHTPVPYGEVDALRFKEELEAAWRELEDVSKKVGIAELEWEDQRKQLLEAIDGTALKAVLDPTRLLMLIFSLCFLQPAMLSSTS